MEHGVHLVVEKGVDAGRRIAVPPQGARLGRSSKNDIVLLDPALSRHHCRLFFKPDEGLHVADLASSNDTEVNGKPVQEARLSVGDVILVGDTSIKVISNSLAPGAAAEASVRLFPTSEEERPKRSLMPLLVGAAVAVTVTAVAIWLPRILDSRSRTAPPLPIAEPVPDRTVEVSYEKIQATAENVFRYSLRITAENRISVQIDDLAHDRHVRKEQAINPEYLADLARSILEAGFFTLEDEYAGIQPDIHDVMELSVTLGRRTHRVRVENRPEPDVFKEVRETIERCGQIELGLWAVQFSPEKLTEMAREAMLRGKKLYDERAIKYSNLSGALKSYQEAEWYLETVEPKPDYYPEILSAMSVCREELQEAYDSHNFRAERSIRLREWEEAAAELTIICETLPDRGDQRHVDARKKLLDISSRLEKRR